VNRGNNIYYRKGISASRPTGTGWVHVPGKLMQIEIYGNQVVGTNPGHVIFKSAVSGISASSMCYCVLAFEVLSNISILPLY
jgi:uncharacterized protein (AIM24 family)